MNVQVRYFAGAREAVGREDEAVELEDGCDVAALLHELVRRHPALDALTPGLRIALGEEFAPRATPLRDGAVVALIPPVGGG